MSIEKIRYTENQLLNEIAFLEIENSRNWSLATYNRIEKYQTILKILDTLNS